MLVFSTVLQMIQIRIDNWSRIWSTFLCGHWSWKEAALWLVLGFPPHRGQLHLNPVAVTWHFWIRHIEGRKLLHIHHRSKLFVCEVVLIVKMAKTKNTPKIKHTKRKQPNAVGIRPRPPGQPGLHSSQLVQSATIPPWTATPVREKRTADNKIVMDHRGEWCRILNTHFHTYTHNHTQDCHHLYAVLTSLLHTNHTDSSLKCYTLLQSMTRWKWGPCSPDGSPSRSLGAACIRRCSRSRKYVLSSSVRTC